MFERITHMLIKEFIQILRDPRMRTVIFAMPLVQTLVDVDGGAMFLVGDHMRYFFDAELGYTFDNGGMHAFNVMGAIGYGRDNFAYAAYQPRLLLGTLDDELTVGMRNAIGGHFFSDMVDVELGHQFVSTNGKLTHGITATAGINLLGILYLFLTAGH